eukprot:1390977-Rhodomonas_salina.1
MIIRVTSHLQVEDTVPVTSQQARESAALSLGLTLTRTITGRTVTAMTSSDSPAESRFDLDPTHGQVYFKFRMPVWLLLLATSSNPDLSVSSTYTGPHPSQ